MKIRILAQGHKLDAEWLAIEQSYLKRFPANWRVELIHLRAERRQASKTVAQSLAQEAQQLRQHLDANSYTIALDETGQDLTSAQLAAALKQLDAQGQTVNVVIGSADGLDETFKASCQARWRLSSLTLPHAMVRTLLIEALYRAWTMLHNHPYHRA